MSDIINRNGFRPGTVTIRMSGDDVPNLSSMRDFGRDADMSNIRHSVSFTSSAPTPRKVLQFSRLRAIEDELQGQKVRVSQDLNNFKMKVQVVDPASPDPLNPRYIEQEMSLGEMLSNRTSLMNSLLAVNRRLEQSSGNIGVNVGQINANLQQVFQTLLNHSIANFGMLTPSEQGNIVDIIASRMAHPDPIYHGFRQYLIIAQDLDTRNTPYATYLRNLFTAYIMARSIADPDPQLTPHSPIYSAANNPINLETLRRALNNGEVLNLATRRLYADGNTAYNDLMVDQQAVQDQFDADNRNGIDPYANDPIQVLIKGPGAGIGAAGPVIAFPAGGIPPPPPGPPPAGGP